MKQPSHVTFFANPRPVLSLLPVLALSVMLTLFVSPSFAEPTAPTVYALTASATGQGIISPSGTLTVHEGERMSFVFNANTDQSITDIIVDGTSLGPIHAFSFENINAPHTIQAVFETDPISITAASDGNDIVFSERTANKDL